MTQQQPPPERKGKSAGSEPSDASIEIQPKGEFRKLMRRLLRVSPEELAEQERAWKAARAGSALE